jgi:hypothetical protein
MKKLFFTVVSVCIVSILSVLSCAAGGKTRNTETPPQNQRQTEAASDVNTPSSLALYFTGDGRKDMSLAIIVPESQGIDKDHAYLPLMIQGCLVANISKYSAIKVLDRVALDKVIAETLDPAYRDNFDIVRLGHITQTGYIMTGTLIKKSYDYTLTINVTDTTPNPQTKAYSANCTLSQLDDQTAIQLASKELLTLMGVKLSDRAISELSTTNQRSINAQTVLAKGITAQRQGFEIEALSYYFQAAKFDPSLPEAASRSEVLAANISSGHIGDDLRNDVQWRKDWIARLAETEQYVKNYNDYYYNYYTDYYNNFYKEYNSSWDSLVRQENAIINQRGTFINSLPAPPYTLYYAVDVRNSGIIDYKTETTSFTGIKALLRGGSIDWKQSVEKAIQTANNSEREMQKAEQDLQEKINEVQRMVQAEQATVEAAIREVVQTVNDGLNATGRRDIWLLKPLNVKLTNAQFNSSLLKTAKPNVPPINKSGSTSFSVTVELVNSKNKVIGANTFMTSGTYSITNTEISVSDDAQNTVDFANVNVNDITDNLTIRIASVNGTPAENASKSGVLQIQAVNAAEWDSAPWNYLIQNGQITQYTGKGGDVTIPRIIWGETVTSIGDNAFADSQLTSVTIGANITLGPSAIDSDFEVLYKRKQAGTYKRNNISSSASSKEELDFSFDPATGTITGYNGDTSRIIIPKTISRIPVTAIGNGAFHLTKIKSVVSAFDTGDWGDQSGLPPGQTSIVIKIGKGIKFDNSAFTDSNFGAYYSGHGRKAGTYSYTYTSNKIVRNVFMGLLTPTLFGVLIPARLIPYGQWKWKYMPEWEYTPDNDRNVYEQ